MLADYIKTGELGGSGDSWLVEGIGEDFIPDIAICLMVKNGLYAISAMRESFATARELLLKREGVLAGSSTGTLLSALRSRFCREQTEAKTCRFVRMRHGQQVPVEAVQRFLDGRSGIHATASATVICVTSSAGCTMSGQRLPIGPNDVLTTAHNRLRNAGFSQLPVMENGELVGVVTEDTIIQFVYGQARIDECRG